MAILDEIRRIAEVEFASIVADVAVMGVKLRIILTDTSYVDVWVSKKLEQIWVPLGDMGFIEAEMVGGG